MGTIIVLAVLAAAIFYAMRGSIAHFKGEGGCCGGGCSEKPEKKRLSGTKVAEKVIKIEGMHCAHCKNSVESQINRIEGAVGNVNLRKNEAVVSMDRMVADDELKEAVERAGFIVLGIAAR